jgi:1,4-dihydroxy-2-naphthoate octaprenyltransferase
MKPPLANLLIALLGMLVIFVGMAIHPSLIVIGLGLLICLIGILFRFERRKARPGRDS